MLTKNRIPLLIAAIICLEIIIYLWAIWTTDPEFASDKCARNSGRVSSLLNLWILLMIGYYGLKQINADQTKWNELRVLMTLFTVNHFIHFYYVFQNFKHHTMALNIADNKHGFITFCCILLFPILLWCVSKMNRLLHVAIILHLFNVCYFIMETFQSKIKPDKPAYHNQLGILVTSLAMLYVLYGVYKEYKRRALVSG